MQELLTFLIMKMNMLKHVTPDTTRKAITTMSPFMNVAKSCPDESIQLAKMGAITRIGKIQQHQQSATRNGVNKFQNFSLLFLTSISAAQIINDTGTPTMITRNPVYCLKCFQLNTVTSISGINSCNEYCSLFCYLMKSVYPRR